MADVIKKYWLIQGLCMALLLLLIGRERAGAQGLVFDQVNTVGTAGFGDGFSLATATAADAQGNVYVTGHFGGIQRFGATTLRVPSGFEVYVAKLDAAGRVLWAVQGGGPGNNYATGIAVDAQGNAYVVGRYAGATATYGTTTLRNSGTGSYFIAKLSAAGQWQWVLGDPDGSATQFNAVAVSPGGVVWVAGSFGSFTRPNARLGSFAIASAGQTDVVVARLSPAGNWLGVSTAGDLYADEATSLALDGSGNAYVAGGFASLAPRFGSHVLAHSPIGPLIGNTNYSTDVFVAKLSPAGGWQWATAGGGTGADVANGIAVDRWQRVYVTGVFYEEGLWGSTRLRSAGSADVFTACLTQDAGTWQWATASGGAGLDTSLGLAATASGYVYVGGSFQTLGGAPPQPARFGNTVLNHAGGEDAFVAQFDSVGVCHAATAAGGVLESACVSVATVGNQVYLAGRISSGINASAEARFGALTVVGNASDYGRTQTGWVARMTAPPRNGTTTPGGNGGTGTGTGGTGTGTGPGGTGGGNNGGTSGGTDPFAGWDARANVPNVITPNEDGLNDYFAPRHLPPGPWSLTIFSRWGTQVYHSIDYQNDWGRTAAGGVYYYVLRHLATRRTYKDWVEVVR